ncbi:MAG: hypothetical protein WD534_00040 [Phycisphaeraceae bacterium]
MDEQLDQLMERASQALVRMDYLTCEALCLEALTKARQQAAWAYYARILLPLQEARRQRRMIAAEGVIRLGTGGLEGSPDDWLNARQAGACIVVTPPHTADHARALDDAARQARRHVEVLYADTTDTDGAGDTWAVQSFRGPAVRTDVPAPPRSWRDQWLAGDAGPAGDSGDARMASAATPADWFLDAAEQLGDAALAQVSADAPPAERLAELEQRLDVVSDHEILHQRLGDAARAMR